MFSTQVLSYFTSREVLKDKSEHLENEARQAKEQVAELGRTATEYSSMIQKKDEQISELNDQLEALGVERDNASMEIMELRADIDTLDAQLNSERRDHAADVSSRDKLQEEMDELRALLATKTTEATRRSEVEKSKEVELSDLRTQASKLQQELTELRRSALETQSNMKVELEQTLRSHTSLQHSHTSLLDRERIAQAQLTKVQAHLSELEKAKRFVDSELLSLKSRQHESQDQLVEVLRAKEVWISINAAP